MGKKSPVEKLKKTKTPKANKSRYPFQIQSRQSKPPKTKTDSKATELTNDNWKAWSKLHE